MHILIIPSWYPTKKKPISGVFFREQAYALKKAGHQVGVIYPERKSIKKFRFKDIKRTMQHENDGGIHTLRTIGWYWFPRIPHANATLFINDGIDLFKQYIGQYGKPDIIHAHSMLFGGVLAARIKRLYNIPFVTTEHSTAFARSLIKPWHMQYLSEVYTKTDKLITVSPELGETLNKQYDCPQGLLEFVPNIVNTEFFKLSDEVQKKNDKFIFLTVSLLTYKKRHRILLDAFGKKFSHRANVELWIGGDGEERTNLEAQVNDLGIKNQVKFLGKLTREQVRQSMQSCDVFVLPSLYETFGVVLIEALACGKPVIATKCGGPECIVNDINGILVPKEDSPALGCAMEKIIRGVEKYDSNLIRKDCDERFSERAVTEKLTAIYYLILENKKTG